MDVRAQTLFVRLTAVAALALGAAQSSPVAATPATTWVETSGAAADDLGVALDGQPVAVTDLGPAPPWRITVWFDEQLSSPRIIRQGADAMIETIAELVALGSVEVIRARPTARVAVPATRDQGLVENALYELLFRNRARDDLRKVRTSFVQTGDLDDTGILGALTTEVAARRAHHDALLEWMSVAAPTPGPRLLLLVSESLFLDSASFYLAAAAPTLQLDAPREPSLEEIGDTAASFGWVVAPIFLPPDSGSRRLAYDPDEELPYGFRVGLGRGTKEEDTSKETLLPDDRIGLDRLELDAATQMALDTGGRSLDSLRAVKGLLRELSARRPMTLEVPDDLLGRVATLTVTPDDVVGPRRIGIGSSDAVSAMRARRFLAVTGDEGPLAVDYVIEASPGRSGTARYELLGEWGAGLEAGGARIRLTTALQLTDGRFLLRHELLSPTADGETTFRHEGTLEVPPDTEAIVASVEVLSTGEWGATFGRFVDSLEDFTPRQRRADSAPFTRLVRLRPPSGTLRGRVNVEAEVDASVAKVVFRLDGATVGTSDRAPYTVRVRLGRKVERHVLEAVALDATGMELDRDIIVLNPPTESFWVRIVEPRSGAHVGPIGVAADVRVPAGEELERVDFYWNDRLVATSRQAPHRRTVLIPFNQPSGFVRVQATLADGRTTDDIVLMNSARFGAAVDVELVELLVVVTDEGGEPVNGLSRGQFKVLDDGEEQEIVDFAAAGDLPITVGLAIDSSSSLFKRFPDVQRSATAFVESLLEDRDRAFVVGFGREPRLVSPTTRDLTRVTESIAGLKTSGQTLIWKGLALSLAQLEGVDGRRALVVFYDGDDEDQKSAYRTALELAEQLGIPIYMIVMNNQAAETDGKGFRTRSFARRLEKVSEAGGGRVFFVRTDANLTEVFAQISNELRSHYLLTYYPDDATARQWRSVQIQMSRRDLAARTISGYDPGSS